MRGTFPSFKALKVPLTDNGHNGPRHLSPPPAPPVDGPAPPLRFLPSSGMDRNELIRLAVAKAQESARGGKMNGKTLIGLAVLGVVLILGFIAYRLIMVELITQLSDH